MKIDLNCKHHAKEEGWIGVCAFAKPDVDIVSDPIAYLQTLDNESVEEIRAEYVLEFITGMQRVLLMNEIYRVLVKRGRVALKCMNWSHERTYIDPRIVWPPVTSMFFFPLKKEWREANGLTDIGYTCDFEWNVLGATDMNDMWLNNRNNETKAVMMQRYVNTTIEIIINMDKR